MAVTTTPRDIIEAAYAKSKLNIPGTIASESTELLQLVGRSLRGLYSFAARINPYFFGASADVSYSAPGWAMPEDAEHIFRIESAGGSDANVAAGTRIWIVPFDDLEAEAAKPSVYLHGGVFHPAGNPPDPNTSTSLRFFYSKRPAMPDELDSPLDSLWREQFNELLILDVAIHLALKDGGDGSRDRELAALTQQRNEWARLFAAHLEHVAPPVRRHGHIRRFNVDTLIPLLAGGSGLEVATAA